MTRRMQISSRDNSYTRSSTKEATEIVLAARKTWKLMRSKKEKVWPPSIEAALIEALQKYRPQSTTDIQYLQRFPKRNCWISKFIKRRTGHDRSPKQVGSRLQQLRDSCRDERILKLLSRKQYDDNDGFSNSRGSTPISDFTTSCSPSSASSSSPGRTEVSANDASALKATLVRIEFTSPPSHSSPSIAFHVTDPEREMVPTLIYIDLKSVSTVNTVFSWKNPTVYLYSAQVFDVVEHHCLSKVFIDGAMVHSQRTEIVLQSTIAQACNEITQQTYLYETKFLPNSWTECFSSTDMACCDVQQLVVKRPRATTQDDPDFLSLKERPEDEVMHTVRYTFADLRSSTTPDGSIEVWTPPLKEALTEDPSTECVVQPSDALGLDAPSFLSNAEPPADGRAHFPVKEESSPNTREYHIFPSSPSLSSEGIPTPSIQSTYDLPDRVYSPTYEFDLRHSASIPASVSSSTYIVPVGSTPQYTYPSTIPHTEWQRQGQWMEQAQEYCQRPTTNDKQYAYFWEQPIPQSHPSFYNRYDDLANTEIEPLKSYLYSQSECSPPSSTLLPSSTYCSRQHDQQPHDGAYAGYGKISHSFRCDGNNGSSSNVADIPDAVVPVYSHLPSSPSYCAQEIGNGYQMYPWT
ncbi:hypothetical protein DFH05DRAFT_1524142 [Lentinula detonsa]|uniref:TEA domain-containing protein n=1 Tax=Lentinula detonsa TaxID=2804962 RepID=A0A9W8P2U1_9AGAR|nr:hypothetical protein DFH05DRAFT_1524142 [Lentinula detonsa]